jgi:hypothetical protein
MDKWNVQSWLEGPIAYELYTQLLCTPHIRSQTQQHNPSGETAVFATQRRQDYSCLTLAPMLQVLRPVRASDSTPRYTEVKEQQPWQPRSYVYVHRAIRGLELHRPLVHPNDGALGGAT